MENIMADFFRHGGHYNSLNACSTYNVPSFAFSNYLLFLALKKYGIPLPRYYLLILFLD